MACEVIVALGLILIERKPKTGHRGVKRQDRCNDIHIHYRAYKEIMDDGTHR